MKQPGYRRWSPGLTRCAECQHATWKVIKNRGRWQCSLSDNGSVGAFYTCEKAQEKKT